MQFQLSTDYAIRIVCYLFRNKTETSVVLSKELAIPEAYLIKVLKKLKDSGLVQSTQGRYGGYQLSKGGEKISVYDVYKAIEGPIVINRCMADDCFCSRNHVADCTYRKFLISVQEEIIQILSNKLISDFN